VLFGLGGALGQATGLIASKKGLEGDFSALSGNLMRLTVATIVIWALAAANGQMRPTAQKLRDHPRAIRFILGGAIAGPFLGVWLSLIAVQNAPVGVASTLTSLTPVFLLPLGWLFFKEAITRRAVVGTALAVAGTAILFLT
jgi:drug/metabolite transporter (DMT)-like permease